MSFYPQHSEMSNERSSNILRQEFASGNFSERNRWGEAWYTVDWVSESVCGNKEWFVNLRKVEDVSVSVAGIPRPVNVRWVGDISFEISVNGTWKPEILSDVCYIPGSPNIISELSLKKNGITANLKRSILTYNYPGPRSIDFLIDGSLIKFKIRPTATKPKLELCSWMGANLSTMLWHNRLCHLAMPYLVKSAKSQSTEIEEKEIDSAVICEDCLRNGEFQPSPILKSLHEAGQILTFFCGKQAVPSLNQNMFIAFVEDFSTGYCWHKPVVKEEAALRYFKSVIKGISSKTTITKLHVGYLESFPIIFHGLREVAAKKAIKINLKSSNELSCSTFANICNTMRLTLSGADLPSEVWEDVFNYIINLANIVPRRKKIIITPTEAFLGEPSLATPLRILGCQAFADRNVSEGYDFSTRISGILVGVTKDGYRIYEKSSKRVYTRKRAIIYEDNVLTTLLQKFAGMYKSAPEFKIPQNSVAVMPYFKQRRMKLNSSRIDNAFELLNETDANDRIRLMNIIAFMDGDLCRLENQCQNSDLIKSDQISTLPKSKVFSGYNLKAKDDFVVLRATANGSCMFNCISLLFFGTECHALLFRLLVLRHILTYWDKLTGICKNVSGVELTELAAIAKSRCDWGHEMMWLFFSEILARPICIHYFHQEAQKLQLNYINSDPKNTKRNWIFINWASNHFEPMIPISLNGFTSIRIENCFDFYANVKHLYEYDSTVHDVRVRRQLQVCPAGAEVAIAPARNKKIEVPVVNPVAECRHCLETDRQMEDALMKLKACHSQNKKLQQQITETLPPAICFQCEETKANQAKLLETKIEADEQSQKYQTWLTTLVTNVKTRNELLLTEVSDLREGQDLMQRILKKRLMENIDLKKDLVILEHELGQRKLAGNQPNITMDDFNFALPTSVPPTPSTPAHLVAKLKPSCGSPPSSPFPEKWIHSQYKHLFKQSLQPAPLLTTNEENNPTSNTTVQTLPEKDISDVSYGSLLSTFDKNQPPLVVEQPVKPNVYSSANEELFRKLGLDLSSSESEVNYQLKIPEKQVQLCKGNETGVITTNTGVTYRNVPNLDFNEESTELNQLCTVISGTNTNKTSTLTDSGSSDCSSTTTVKSNTKEKQIAPKASFRITKPPEPKKPPPKKKVSRRKIKPVLTKPKRLKLETPASEGHPCALCTEVFGDIMTLREHNRIAHMTHNKVQHYPRVRTTRQGQTTDTIGNTKVAEAAPTAGSTKPAKAAETGVSSILAKAAATTGSAKTAQATETAPSTKPGKATGTTNSTKPGKAAGTTNGTKPGKAAETAPSTKPGKAAGTAPSTKPGKAAGTVGSAKLAKAGATNATSKPAKATASNGTTFISGEPEFQCSLCNNPPYTTKASLLRHIEYDHSNNTARFECKCGRTYWRWDGYQKHLRDKHESPQGPFKCRWCSKQLMSKKCIDNHERRDHFKEYIDALPEEDE